MTRDHWCPVAQAQADARHAAWVAWSAQLGASYVLARLFLAAVGASCEDGRGMGEGQAANGSRAAGHITEEGTSREVGSPRPTPDATATRLERAA